MVSKVLVVDDSLADRNHLESLLTQAGYSVVTVNDGSHAVDAVKKHRIEAVLMDVNMPGMDGFAATRALKNDAETKDVPVIMVTAKDQKADKAWGQMLGAKGYVTKPYTNEDVLAQVRAL